MFELILLRFDSEQSEEGYFSSCAHEIKCFDAGARPAYHRQSGWGEMQ